MPHFSRLEMRDVLKWRLRRSLRLALIAALLGFVWCFKLLEPSQPRPLPPPLRPPPPPPTLVEAPFLSCGLRSIFVEADRASGKSVALKGISIQLGPDGEAAVCFDTELLRVAYGWTGGFVKLPVRREGFEGMPEAEGRELFSTLKGPGWARSGSFADPRPRWATNSPPYGSLPKDWARWKGLHLNGNQVILSYRVGETDVLETPGFERRDGLAMITRTVQLTGQRTPHALLVCEDTNGVASVDGKIGVVRIGEDCVAAGVSGGRGTFQARPNGRLELMLPALQANRAFQVSIWRGPTNELGRFQKALAAAATEFPNLTPLTNAGPARWTTPIVTQGKVGTEAGPYVVDTLTLPTTNPWHSRVRCGGFDFFQDGRAAVCTLDGEVWIVSGIDDKLERLTWKRFAAGLFQPLGLKIVNDRIFVVGRDQITRLHDLNNDGEADFYENFNNDVTITGNYHEFCMSLETDSQGNFYFAKGSNQGKAEIPHHGCLLKVSKDGSKLETVATGFREANGLGIGPADEITTSDNDGNWVPSSRIDWIKPGGFYGFVPAAHRKDQPTSYDPPLCWIPRQVDNSAGGQIWVTSDRWGPLQGQILHTSYGSCSLFLVLRETTSTAIQGGVVKFPLRFDSGIMRGRFNPSDGQLYLCGLRVWDSSGAKETAFQRVRYTGLPVRLPVSLTVRSNGLALGFTCPLDRSLATDLENYAVDQWNYQWSAGYGSLMYSVSNTNKVLNAKSTPSFKGENIEVKSAQLEADGKTVFLEIPELQPVMQMRIRFNLEAADGHALRQEIYHTINTVPGWKPGQAAAAGARESTAQPATASQSK